MSYHYFLNENVTITSDRLTSVAQQFGYRDYNHQNLEYLCELLNQKYPGALFVPEWGNGLRENLSVLVGSFGWTPEHKGVEGIVSHLSTFSGLVDSVLVHGRDDYGAEFTVHL